MTHGFTLFTSDSGKCLGHPEGKTLQMFTAAQKGHPKGSHVLHDICLPQGWCYREVALRETQNTGAEEAKQRPVEHGAGGRTCFRGTIHEELGSLLLNVVSIPDY